MKETSVVPKASLGTHFRKARLRALGRGSNGQW